MTVDEIFSSESEHLYFRLIAARNALNAANDSDTVQVLNDILDETLNNIDRIGTEEEIAAAEEIVVRKSNKTVKDYLTSQKFSLIATAVMIVTAVGAALALLLIILGSSDKLKPIIAVVIVAAGIIGMAFFVSNYMKKRMNVAREALKGRTVIGCKINTNTAVKTNTPSKRERSESGAGKTKVVRNYGGIIKVVLIVGVLGALGFTIFTKWDDIVISAKTIMYNIGLYDPAPAQSIDRYQEINKKLVSVKKGINYNEAESLMADGKYEEAAEMYMKCYGYNDEIEAKIVDANNFSHYVKASELVSTSMVQAYTELNKIKLPFKNVKINGKRVDDAESLLNQYARHIDFIGVYGSGDNTFTIKDFAIKGYTLYIVDDKQNQKKVMTGIDREGYSYLVQEKKGDETVKWYVASDHVLKVVGEEETVLRK